MKKHAALAPSESTKDRKWTQKYGFTAYEKYIKGEVLDQIIEQSKQPK